MVNITHNIEWTVIAQIFNWYFFFGNNSQKGLFLTRRSCVAPNSALFSNDDFFLSFATEKSHRIFIWREGYILFSLLTGNKNDLVKTVKTMRIKILRKFLY